MTDHETITLTSTAFGDQPETAFTVPRQLGSVRLVRELGRGGMGVVWLGHDELLRRDVAVKFLLNAVAGPDDPGFVRFIEGARAAAGVRHSGLTSIYHADLVSEIPYLVMEYVAGPALSQLVRRCGTLQPDAALAVLDAIADAVGALHDQGIVHQDIKPGNVLLDVDGHAYVTDFGLAHARAALDSAVAQRAAGTPAYMAPELFTGEVSPRSDVYALGVMGFELLVGELPYTGTLEEIRELHRQAPLPAAKLENSGFDADLIEVLNRATHKGGVYRYKTATHFCRALREACPDLPGRAVGQRKLAILVAQCLAGEPASAAREVDEKTPSSYYDTLAARAEAKRRDTPSHIDDQPADQPDIIPVAGAIIDDLPCVQCEGNLRGSLATATCPRCDAPVSDSLRADRLIFARPRWLRSLAWGQTTVLVAALAMVAVLAGWAVVRAATDVWPNQHVAVIDSVFGVGMALFEAGLLIGVWLSTTRWQATHLTLEQTGYFWLARAAIPLSFVAIVVATSHFVWRNFQARITPPMEETAVILQVLDDISATLPLLSMWMFLAPLARRASHEQLARHLHRGAIVMALILLVLLATIPLRLHAQLNELMTTLAAAALLITIYLAWQTRRWLQQTLAQLVSPTSYSTRHIEP